MVGENDKILPNSSAIIERNNPNVVTFSVVNLDLLYFNTNETPAYYLLVNYLYKLPEFIILAPACNPPNCRSLNSLWFQLTALVSAN